MNNDERKFNMQTAGVTIALLISIGGIIVSAAVRVTSQADVNDFQDRRLGALETWQTDTRSVIHDIDKKIDRQLQWQAQVDRKLDRVLQEQKP